MLLPCWYIVTPWQISNKFHEQIPITHVNWKPSLIYLHNSQYTHNGTTQETDSVCVCVCVKSNITKIPTQRQLLSQVTFLTPLWHQKAVPTKYHMSMNPIQRQFNPVHVLAPHSFKFHSNHILSVPILYVVHIQYFRMSPCIIHLMFPHPTNPQYREVLFTFSQLGTNILHSTLFSYTLNVTFLTLRRNMTTVTPCPSNYSCHI